MSPRKKISGYVSGGRNCVREKGNSRNHSRFVKENVVPKCVTKQKYNVRESHSGGTTCRTMCSLVVQNRKPGPQKVFFTEGREKGGGQYPTITKRKINEKNLRGKM